MREKTNDALTWFQVNNLVPLITSAIIIALSWGALNARLSLIEQKVDYIANTLEKHYEEAKIRDTEVNHLQEEIAVIKSILKY